MEAVEIYNGIAKAVEAAKPAQEYCFLWLSHWSTCMTKSEWSGWAQAIGVAFALASPWIKGKIDKYRSRPVARDVYLQSLRMSKVANRLDAIILNALGNPALLNNAHQEAVAIIRSLREVTDFEIEALRLYSGVAASRLRTCGAIQSKISGVLDLPMDLGKQHFALQIMLEDAYKHARDLRKNINEAVLLMEQSGLNVRNSSSGANG
ncbi:hypothetical protein ABN448_21950 [Delftia acidovorans]|uniref:hypothetical protein n=1 Tax=Delftia acidovorans TaxID=80866 RepID=UPI0032DF2F67